jgi:hypothetical protein
LVSLPPKKSEALSSNLITEGVVDMSNNEMLGLTPRKSGAAVDGSRKTVNIKFQVDAEFHADLTAIFKKLASQYSGGLAAVTEGLLRGAMPQLRAMADGIPAKPNAPQKANPTVGKGGAV